MCVLYIFGIPLTNINTAKVKLRHVKCQVSVKMTLMIGFNLFEMA